MAAPQETAGAAPFKDVFRSMFPSDQEKAVADALASGKTEEIQKAIEAVQAAIQVAEAVKNSGFEVNLEKIDQALARYRSFLDRLTPAQETLKPIESPEDAKRVSELIRDLNKKKTLIWVGKGDEVEGFPDDFDEQNEYLQRILDQIADLEHSMRMYVIDHAGTGVDQESRDPNALYLPELAEDIKVDDSLKVWRRSRLNLRVLTRTIGRNARRFFRGTRLNSEKMQQYHAVTEMLQHSAFERSVKQLRNVNEKFLRTAVDHFVIYGPSGLSERELKVLKTWALIAKELLGGGLKVRPELQFTDDDTESQQLKADVRQLLEDGRKKPKDQGGKLLIDQKEREALETYVKGNQVLKKVVFVNYAGTAADGSDVIEGEAVAADGADKTPSSAPGSAAPDTNTKPAAPDPEKEKADKLKSLRAEIRVRLHHLFDVKMGGGIIWPRNSVEEASIKTSRDQMMNALQTIESTQDPDTLTQLKEKSLEDTRGKLYLNAVAVAIHNGDTEAQEALQKVAGVELVEKIQAVKKP